MHAHARAYVARFRARTHLHTFTPACVCAHRHAHMQEKNETRMFGHTFGYSHARAQVLACSHTSALQKIKPDQIASTKCGHVFCYDCMSALCRRPGFPTAPGLIGLGFAVCAALCLGGKTVTLWKGLAYQRRAEKCARRVNLPHLQRGWTHPCCICTGTGSYAHTPPRLASARFFFPCRLAGTRVCRAVGCVPDSVSSLSVLLAS
jgi:hypothetical protein